MRATEVTRSYAEVQAPFAGIVHSEIGGSGKSGDARRAAADHRARGWLPAGSIGGRIAAGAIRIGQPVAVTLDGIDRTLDARVSEIVPAVDAASRSYTVKIDLPADAGLALGHFRTRDISTGQPAGAGDSLRRR